MVEGRKGVRRMKGDCRGVWEEGVDVLQGNGGCRGEVAHQPPPFHLSMTAALFTLKQQKIDRAIYLCTELQRPDEQTCKPQSRVSFLS